MSLPDFVIVGAMKCGTSTLHAQLAEQGRFFMSEPKEPNLFSDDDVYAKGLAWYRGLFDAAGPGQIKGEASTHYAKRPTYRDCMARLLETLPDIKIVYMMRHPVDRLISHYIHEWTMAVISAPIDEAIGRHPELIDYSRYAYQLEPFIEAYGRARVLPVFLERMNAFPDEELSRVSRFLGGADACWKTDLGDQNVSRDRIRNFPLRGLLVDHPVAAGLRRALAPRWLRDRVKARFQMRERPVLSPETRAAVEKTFDEDLARLSAGLTVPLTCATFKDAVVAAPPEWKSA